MAKTKKIANGFANFFIMLLAMGCSHFTSVQAENVVVTAPSAETRKQMLVTLVNEIDRIDGEGLLPRSNRPESWEKTTARLAEESFHSNSLFDLGRVFKRLDATYPNLHAKVFMLPELDEKETLGSVELPFKFYNEKIDQKGSSSKYLIIVEKKQNSPLQTGDELVAINSVPMQKWSEENFNFCKFPFRQQCEIELYDNLRNELLGWDRHQPLELSVKRGSEEKSIVIVPQIKQSSEIQDDSAEGIPCGVKKNRYEGFTLAYEGQHLCAFESLQKPGVVTIRIDSFRYEDVPFAVLDGEVQIFWNNYWSKKASKVKTLVLDVIGNWGGQSPVPYYALFYSKPYQEQYVKFKKIKEFEQKEILESLFWGDKGKEKWFENIKADGSFAQTPVGDFLGHIPQFCADRKKDCREGLFQPRKNRFSGNVKLLMDHWCISSCVGFVSNIKDLLKDRVQTFGMPDSGDSAYSRLSVLVSPRSSSGVSAEVAPMKKARTPDKPEPWVRQVVSVTRSTDKEGNLLSGKPQKIDVWIPRMWNQTESDWAAAVFQAAIK